MLDVVVHKWLRIPYALNVREYNRPKKPRATIILLHGIGSSSKMWIKLVDKLPSNVRIIAVDLLGFGESPKPSWKIYSAKTQADSLVATLAKLRIHGPVIIVGHSLGALVAIEFTKRYRLFVRQLILCSPPLYRPAKNKKYLLTPESILRSFYRKFHQSPTSAKRLLAFASKYGYLNPGFMVDDSNITAYLASLETSIINQTSIDDLQKITKPVHIYTGKLDMFVIEKNIRYLKKINPFISGQSIAAGHEIVGIYQMHVARKIKESIDNL